MASPPTPSQCCALLWASSWPCTAERAALPGPAPPQVSGLYILLCIAMGVSAFLIAWHWTYKLVIAPWAKRSGAMQRYFPCIKSSTAQKASSRAPRAALRAAALVASSEGGSRAWLLRSIACQARRPAHTCAPRQAGLSWPPSPALGASERRSWIRRGLLSRSGSRSAASK